MTDEQGCLCQECSNRYRVDLLIPDALWARIGMPTEGGSGLLCGVCIMLKVEGLGEFEALNASADVPVLRSFARYLHHLDTMDVHGVVPSAWAARQAEGIAKRLERNAERMADVEAEQIAAAALKHAEWVAAHPNRPIQRVKRRRNRTIEVTDRG